MHPQDVFSGQADGTFERIVCRMVLERGLRVQTLTPELVVGTFADSPRALIVARYRPQPWPELTALLKQTRQLGVDLALVGGGDDGPRALRQALPTYTGAGISAWHVDPVPELIAGSWTSPGDALHAPPPPDWPRFWEALERISAAATREARTLGTALADRRPIATTALVAAFALVFVAELAVGADTLPPAALRMGALSRDRVLAGEIWRLASATFLHGSLIHLAFNGMVTWGLGSQLERILGTARFCLLYASCALAGSLLSLVFLEGYSVGASGALWGLMTAQAVLSVRGKGILPDRVLTVMRAGAGQNLVLNVLNSFRPGVDWAAHAGGGVMGALLALAGLVTVGMPRWAEAEEGADLQDRVPLHVRIGGAVGMALLVAGGLVGLLAGQVWTLRDPPTYRPETVQGWNLELPAALTRAADEGEEASWGELLADPAVVAVLSKHFDAPLEAEVLEAEAGAVLEQLNTPPAPGYTPVGSPRRVEGTDSPLLVATYRTDHVRAERAIVLRPTGFVRVDTVSWTETAEAWTGVAEHVAASAR